MVRLLEYQREILARERDTDLLCHEKSVLPSTHITLVNTDVYTIKIYLDTSILTKSIMDQSEY
jgi:hypothetical protein